MSRIAARVAPVFVAPGVASRFAAPGVAPRFAARLVPVVLAVILAACAGPRPTGPPSPVKRPPAPAEPAPPPLVRVALVVDAKDVQVGASQPFALSDEDGILVVGMESEVFSVRAASGRLEVYTPTGELVDTAEGTLRVDPRGERGDVIVNGARYPQALEVVQSPRTGLTAINVTDVETYLRGVVPLEIGHRGAEFLEAAKAQAVAARTYVAGHLGQYPGEKFDFHSGVTDQVYGPVEQRHPDADRAVNETRGVILVYQGKPIRANYASTCGGVTAGVEESFPVKPIPYLASHLDAPNGQPACRTSRYFRWDETWTEKELAAVLARTVPRVLSKPWKGSRLRDLQVLGRGASGRVVRLRIETDQASYVVEQGAIRQILESTAGRPLRSTAFEIETWRRGEGVRMIAAHGRGWGHGVGMCQWGAMQLSQEGYDYRRILGHYYPGTQFKVWYAAPVSGRGSREETRDG